MNFRNTIERVKFALEEARQSWNKSGSLYKKPLVISRHEGVYRPWFNESLDAARQHIATLHSEEIDRLTVVVHHRGYRTVEGNMKSLHPTCNPGDVAYVEILADLHERVMYCLKDLGLFEQFPPQLLSDASQRREPGAMLVIAFNEMDPANASACVSQIMKTDEDLRLSPEKIQSVADVDERGQRPGIKFGTREGDTPV